MIHVGIDDTDVQGSPGTNQLAKELARFLVGRYRCRMILRHQLFVSERVPYTSKNSAATLLLSPDQLDANSLCLDGLFDDVASFVKQHSAVGSDPGVCLGREISRSVTEFGVLCKSTLRTQQQARQLAREARLRLAGLGGTRDGVIGAVAAVGLAASGDDGRIVMIDGQDNLSGICRIDDLRERGVEVRCHFQNRTISEGHIDVGKHLRPNLREGRIVQFAVESSMCHASGKSWKAVRLP